MDRALAKISREHPDDPGQRRVPPRRVRRSAGSAAHLKRLLEVSELVSSSLDLDRVLATVTKAALDVLGGDLARLWIVDEATGGLTLTASQNRRGAEPPDTAPTVLPRDGLLGWVIENRAKRVSPRLQDDPLLITKNWMGQAGYVSLVAVPLTVETRALGALVILWKRRPRLTAQDEEILEIFGAKAATALENARRYEESRRHERRLEALVEVTQNLTRGLDLASVLTRIFEAAARVFEGDAGLRLIQGDALVRVGATPGALPMMKRERLALGESLSGRVAMTGEPIVVADLRSDPRFLPEHRNELTLERDALMLVPIRTSGRILGTLSIYREHGYRFSPDDIKLAMTLADQAAIALENARLYDERRRRNERLETLVRLTRLITSSTEPRQVFDFLTHSTEELLQARLVRLWMIDPEVPEEMTIVATAGLDGETELGRTVRTRIRIGEGVVGEIAQSRQAEFIADVRTDSRWLNRTLLLTRAAGYSFAGLPLLVGNKVVGVLSVLGTQPFPDDERDLLAIFADQAAIAVENARLYAATVERGEQVGALLRAGRAVMAELDLDAMLERILDEASQIVRTPNVKIYLVDRQAGVLRPVASRGVPVPEGFTVPIGRSFSGKVAATGKPVFVADTQSDPDNLLPERDRQFGINAFLGLPIKAAGEVLGVLVFNTEQRCAYTAEDLDYLGSFADQAAVAIRNANLYKAMTRRLTRVRRLTQLNQLISSSLDTGEVLAEITRAATELMAAQMASFWTVDEATRTLVMIASANPEVGADYPIKRLGFDESLAGQVAITREPLNVPDVFADGHTAGLDWWRRYGLTSFFALPVIHKGVLLAVLALNGRTPFRFEAEDQDILDSFVAQAAVALRNTRLFKESETRRRMAEAIAEVGQELSRTLDPDVVGERIVGAISTLLDAHSAAVYRLEPESEDLVTIAVAGRFGELVGRNTVLPRGTNVAGLAVARRAPVATPAFLQDPDVRIPARLRSRMEAAGDHAVLSVPLMIQGRPVGALSIAGVLGRSFTREEIRLAQTFADQAALALESARLYREAQRAIKDLGTKNTELDSFVYSVSHDLKAPLVALQGMSGALLEDYGPALDADGRHYIQRLQANVEQMERLIGDLLVFSRVGREAQRSERVDLAEVVGGVLSEWAGPIGQQSIQITVEPLGVVWGVRTQLAQVFGNLIGNAVKYMGDGPKPAIEVGAREGDGMLECWVRDTGIGIDPEYHQRIFEIFERLKDAKAEGSGVGLAIVKKIVDRVGGRVWVESSSGQGSTFWFAWPRGRREGVDAPVALGAGA